MWNKLVHNLDLEEFYEDEIEPKLREMSWVDQAAGKVYQDHEDTYEDKYVFKLILTLSLMNNFVAERKR